MISARVHPEIAEAAASIAQRTGKPVTAIYEEAIRRFVTHHEDLPAEDRVELMEQSFKRFCAIFGASPDGRLDG
jgi:predicted transcriptional regulator